MRIMIKGGVWKNTEDEILKAAVMKYGKQQWSRIASLMSRKSAKQCKARWYEWLDPAIKKTEWTREEDEKLLHLAKLMPTQWRTIAPIVGRTAAQCIERYERLLDMAQTGSSSQELDENDPRRLRIGEIDPNPETRPARPDPVDMDEDEKEMLSEARARLANTRGKKAKRKARERALDNARRLVALQKQRELKVAGIRTSRTRKRKKGEMDFISEVPNEVPVPAGFYDTSHEAQEGVRRAKHPKYKAQVMNGINEERTDVAEEKRRKREADNQKKLAKFNLPLIMSRVEKANNPQFEKVRSKLNLPAPRVSDAELEDIAKLGSYAADTNATAIETSNSGASTGTKGLLGDYSQVPTPLVSVAAAASSNTNQVLNQGRSVLRSDMLMEEARHEISRVQAQTPLLGGSVESLAVSRDGGTGFHGATPVVTSSASVASVVDSARSAVIGGSAKLLAPSNASSIVGKQSSVSTMSNRSIVSSLRRDEYNLNNDDPDQLLDEALVSEQERQAEEERARNALKLKFKALPKPKNEDTSIMMVVDDGDETHQLAKEITERDAAQIEAEKQREEEILRELAIERQSMAIRRGLPRPRSVNFAFGQLKQVNVGEISTNDQTESAIDSQMNSLLQRDSAEFPLVVAHGQNDSSEVRKEHSTTIDDGITLEQINAAKEMVNEEAQNVRSEWIKLTGVDSAEAFESYYNTILAKRATHVAIPAGEVTALDAYSLKRPTGKVVRAEDASDEEAMQAKAVQCVGIHQALVENAKKIAKYSKKVSIQTLGFQKRVAKAKLEMTKAYEDINNARDDLAGFNLLAAHEGIALHERVKEQNRLAAEQVARENELQKRFAMLTEQKLAAMVTVKR